MQVISLEELLERSKFDPNFYSIVDEAVKTRQRFIIRYPNGERAFITSNKAEMSFAVVYAPALEKLKQIMPSINFEKLFLDGKDKLIRKLVKLASIREIRNGLEISFKEAKRLLYEFGYEEDDIRFMPKTSKISKNLYIVRYYIYLNFYVLKFGKNLMTIEVKGIKNNEKFQELNGDKLVYYLLKHKLNLKNINPIKKIIKSNQSEDNKYFMLKCLAETKR